MTLPTLTEQVPRLWYPLMSTSEIIITSDPHAVVKVRKQSRDDLIAILKLLPPAEQAEVAKGCGWVPRVVAEVFDRSAQNSTQQVEALCRAWEDSWDCSQSPGHDAMCKAAEEARLFLERGAGAKAARTVVADTPRIRAALVRLYGAAEAYFTHHGAEHEGNCPEDDTCECPLVNAINEAFANALPICEASAVDECKADGIRESASVKPEPPTDRDRAIVRAAEAWRVADKDPDTTPRSMALFVHDLRVAVDLPKSAAKGRGR